MRYLEPSSILKGDVVGIVSPAGIVDRQKVEDAIFQLQYDGFRVKLGTYVYGQHGVFSGTDEQRIQDLQQMVNDPKVKIILCARGGYGCARIVNQIHWEPLVDYPKWLVGFSDITVLHSKLHKLGMKSIHGTMANGFFNSSGDVSENYFELIEMLLGNKLSYEWDHGLSHDGVGDGMLVGGNLAMLQSLRGTPLDLQWKDRILFIEEIGEHYYQIDRMLLNLYQGGVFHQIKGLVVGQFTDCKNGAFQYHDSLEEIVDRYTSHLKIPVAYGLESGHEERNRPLLFGHPYQLIVNKGHIRLNMLP